MVAFFRGIAQLVARRIWDADAASSSLATPTYKKKGINMTAQEVVWFINHKYGEQAYIVETNDQILLFTKESKWVINKNDYSKFHCYTLFHSNNKQGNGFHVQMRGNHIDFLVYQAIMHDNKEIFSNRETWDNFQNAWELFLLGRKIEAEISAWEWMTK